MAEEERLTKRERRQKKREERKKEEARKQRRQLRRRITTGVVSVLVVAFVGFIVWTAFAGDEGTIEETVTVAASAVEEATTAAECEVVGPQTEFERAHYTQGQAPPADAIYAIRPPIGGPHFENTHPLVRDGSSTQLDEVQTTHNLEHGAVIVWYDPEAVSGDDIGEMEAWSESLNDSGFAVSRAGTGVMVSPYEDPGLPEGTAVAMRAWGAGQNCASWDETAANGFVLQYYGDRGVAPEGNFAPFPTDLMSWEGDPLPNAFQAAPPPQGGDEAETTAPTEGATATEDTSG